MLYSFFCFPFSICDVSDPSSISNDCLKGLGFYHAGPVDVELPAKALNVGNEKSMSQVIGYFNQPISFDNGYEIPTNLINHFIDSFPDLDGSSTLITENISFCDIELDQLETEFNTGSDYSIWMHIAQDDPESGNGELFLKALVNNEIAPQGKHLTHLENTQNAINNANSSTIDIVYATLGNLVMNKRSDGFETSNLEVIDCIPRLSSLSYMFLSSGIPVRNENSISQTKFEFHAPSKAFPGMLSQFNEDGKVWISYYSGKEEPHKFHGFYYDLEAEFYNDFKYPENPYRLFNFFIPRNQLNNCEINVASGIMELSKDIILPNTQDGGKGKKILQHLSDLGKFDTRAGLTKINVCPDILDENIWNSAEEIYAYNGYTVYKYDDGNATRMISCIDDPEDPDELIYFEYIYDLDYSAGCWVSTEPVDTDLQELANLLNDIQTTIEWSHIVLDGIGATGVPIVSQLSDFINAGIYGLEGQAGNAIISVAAIAFEGAILFRAPNRLGKSSIKVTNSGITHAGKAVFKNSVDELVEIPVDELSEKLYEAVGESDGLFNYYSKKLVGDLDPKKNLELLGVFAENPKLVRAWEKLFHNTIPQAIRTNTTYLSAASKQIDNYGSQIAFQFERTLPHIDAGDLDDFFLKLDNPKSIDHVKSLAGDFENIPGINLSAYVPNNLPNVDIPAPGTWADPLLYLPGNAAKTFTGSTAKTLSPNQKIYRVLGEDQSSLGGYWTYQLPSSKAELFGGTAVRPEWNAATHYVEYTVPSGGLKVWDGPTASQRILDEIDEVNLPGGDLQIYIPDPYRQVGSAFENLPKIPISL